MIPQINSQNNSFSYPNGSKTAKYSLNAYTRNINFFPFLFHLNKLMLNIVLRKGKEYLSER